MKKFFLYLLIIVVVFIIILIQVNKKKEIAVEPASPEQINHIHETLKNRDNIVKNAFVLKSKSHNQAYYVIAFITGEDQAEDQKGVWFIYGTKDNPGMIQCVDPGACDISVVPESGSTKSGANMESVEYQILHEYALNSL